MITGTYNIVAQPEVWQNLQTAEIRLECDTTVAPVVINLCQIAALLNATNVKFIIVDANGNASVNNITINPGAGNTIDGAANKVVNTDKQAVVVAVASETDWMAFEAQQANPSNSRVIASLNLNLKDINTNQLAWAVNKSAANTANPVLVVKLRENDTYVVNNIAEVPATTTVVFNAAAFPDNLGLAYTLRMLIDATEIYSNVVGAGFATVADYMDYVKTTLEGLGYGIVVDGLNMQITDKAGNGATTNGKVTAIESRDENAGIFTNNLTSSPAFGGGVTAESTDFTLKLNGENMVAGVGSYTNTIKSLIAELTYGKSISTPLIKFGTFPSPSLPIFSESGNWALPVTLGTLNDFRITILILGDTIN